MKAEPFESFQALRAAAATAPEPVDPVGRTLWLVSESSPPFLVAALEAEARRRGERWRVRGEAAEEIAGGLLALRANEDDSGERPEAILVIPSIEALFEQFLALPEEERRGFAAERMAAWRAARKAWHESGVPLWWATFVPFPDGLEGLAGDRETGFSAQLEALQMALRKDAAEESNLRIFELGRLAAWHGRREVFDPRWWQEGRLAFALDFLPTLAFHLVNALEAASGRSPKVVVCDLDDTLWGGILADDGIENLKIGAGGEGAPFLQFQRWLLALRERGLLLAIASKNDEERALEALRTLPGSVLRPEHFSAMRINFEPKSENLRAIAEELNLGLDSFVFLDDQPFERAEVRERCPEVRVPELPSAPEERLPFLQGLSLFGSFAGSSLDARRGQLYAEEASRRSARDPHADYASYLASLDLRAEVSTLTPANLDRVLQLSLRSNQFNFRTHRYSRKELVAALEDPQRVWTLLSLRDRFGDYGLVAVVDAVLARAGGAEIRNWFMSCRVLQRGMEACTMNQLAKRLRAAGATQVRLPFSPTPKNGLVAELPRVLGWSSDAESPNLWHLDLASYSPLKTPIQVSAS